MSKTRQFLAGFRKGMKNFGLNIALIINSLLLSGIYLIGVGLTSIMAKISGKKFFETRLSKKNTYWSELSLKKKKIEDYYRQF